MKLHNTLKPNHSKYLSICALQANSSPYYPYMSNAASYICKLYRNEFKGKRLDTTLLQLIKGRNFNCFQLTDFDAITPKPLAKHCEDGRL